LTGRGKENSKTGHQVWVWILSVLLLAISGIAYRVIAKSLKSLDSIELPVPLSSFPREVGDWSGRELTLPKTTARYLEQHFADDYINRRYVNSRTGEWADLYIVYCATRIGGILGHRPRVCYPGAGWIHDESKRTSFTTSTGREIPCLVHRFYKQMPPQERVVLNFYILNGRITTDESEFRGLFGRRPNIEGDPARYVAQVQITSTAEHPILQAAQDFSEMILDFLPDKEGQVKAALFYDTSSLKTANGK